MQGAGTFSDRAQEILAQYPGPVVLYRPKLKWFWQVLLWLFLIGLGLFWILSGARFELEVRHASWITLTVHAVLIIFMMLVSIWAAAYVAIPTLMLWGGRGKLIFDQAGFRTWRRKNDFIRWEDASNFKSLPWGYFKNCVFFKERNPPRPYTVTRAAYTAHDVNTYLAQTCGFKPDELAKLMNAWRERALAKENKNYGSSSVSQ
jgi:hypothetical protein